MSKTNIYYVVKLFSIKFNEYSYLYVENPYKTIYIADRFPSYEEGYARMQEFFQWNGQRKDFDMSKSKVCKIILIEEDM
jgi:hypothetical protein